MNEKIKAGDLVRHIHLQDSPDMYVVETNKRDISCRYYSGGIFHLETFVPEELMSKEEAKKYLEKHRGLGLSPFNGNRRPAD